MRQKKVQAIVTVFLQQEILCPYYTLLETERDRERQRETERNKEKQRETERDYDKLTDAPFTYTYAIIQCQEKDRERERERRRDIASKQRME